MVQIRYGFVLSFATLPFCADDDGVALSLVDAINMPKALRSPGNSIAAYFENLSDKVNSSDCLQVLCRFERDGFARTAGRLLDVVFLMALTPHVRCIVKHELWDNRYLKGVVRAAGYIRNDLDPEATIAACRAALQQGNNLVIFPEGTRSRIGLPVQFRRGVANIAMLTGAPIQLVVISCNPLTLTKGEPWYRVPPRRPRFQVEVAHPMDIQRFMAYPYRGLGARRLMQELHQFYTGRLAHG